MAEHDKALALLPCPFCGGDARVEYIEEGENCSARFIACEKCGACTNLRFATGDDPVPLLREAWNHRAPAATAPALLSDEQIIDVFFKTKGENQSDYMIKVARAILAAAAPAEARDARWQAMETAPKDHFAYLVYGPKVGAAIAFRDVTWRWLALPSTKRLGFTPTHWMPLPEPPSIDATMAASPSAPSRDL